MEVTIDDFTPGVDEAVGASADIAAVILTQGQGTYDGLQVSTRAMIRFGQMTEDELFVSADAAKAGVKIENRSDSDPLVILKHFGPGNPEAPKR